MEKIETVGDLRKFIAAQGGEFTIGKISITASEQQDIDFIYDYQVTQWISTMYADDVRLSSTIYSHMTNVGMLPKKIEESVEKPEPMAEQKATPIITIDDPIIVAGYKAEGAVEAYEKLFITSGRKITLE